MDDAQLAPRQVLTQSVLLSLIGGAAGLAVGYALSHIILALAFPQARAMPVQATPSLIVLGFAYLVSAATGFFFGMPPPSFRLMQRPQAHYEPPAAASATARPCPRKA